MSSPIRLAMHRKARRGGTRNKMAPGKYRQIRQSFAPLTQFSQAMRSRNSLSALGGRPSRAARAVMKTGALHNKNRGRVGVRTSKIASGAKQARGPSPPGRSLFLRRRGSAPLAPRANTKHAASRVRRFSLQPVPAHRAPSRSPSPSRAVPPVSSSSLASRPATFRFRTASRSLSPVFPKTHNGIGKPTAFAMALVPQFYHVNAEISWLASHFVSTGRRLPPIHVPLVNGNPTFPASLPVYAISIREERARAFVRRFPQGQIWTGTNGYTMNVDALRKQGKLATTQLKRGEIGCYDSHLRLWKHLADRKVPMALICEDDVNLTGSADQCRYLDYLLREINEKGVNFDVLFLSWFRPVGASMPVTSHTQKQWTFCQLWAYLVTAQGLRKMTSDKTLQQMNEPVDVALWSAHAKGTLLNLVAYPPMCLTVGEYSDTANLRLGSNNNGAK